MMSYSQETKAELAAMSLGKRCCRRAEIAAFVRFGSTIEILSGGKLAVRFDTDLPETAQRISSLLESIYHETCQVAVREGQRLYKHDTYQVRVTGRETASAVLEDGGIFLTGDWDPEQPQLPQGRIDRDCCRKAFLRGAFLAAGSVNDPSGDYHLEIISRDEELTQLLIHTLESYGIEAHTVVRKEQWSLYLKEGDAIVDFLSVIGAFGAVLQMENARAEKNLRGQVNRQVNCENANLDKTADASARQLEAIRILEEKQLLRRMTPALREAAELRYEHPEASLQELSDMLPGVTRSAMNHRLRKLVEAAAPYMEVHS